MRKPTLHDVARRAGVSYATADRVLNARGGVAEKSIQRVQQAIEDLGYERDLQAANLSRRRIYRFRFVLPQGDHSFFRILREAVEAEQTLRKADRIVIEVREVPALDYDALAVLLETMDRDCDCLAVVAADTPRVAAAISALTGEGLPVVTLVGDAAPEARAVYVGIDNVVAGRTAGRLIRLAHHGRRGKVLPILGTMNARDHSDRVEGARLVLAEPGADLALMPAIEVHDRADLMRERVGGLLASDRDITAVYSIGGGNRALVDLLSRLPGPRPFFVMHEVTPTSRDGLARDLVDAVIDQKPEQEVALALDVMRALADGRDLPNTAGGITPTIYFKDNLPQSGGAGDRT